MDESEVAKMLLEEKSCSNCVMAGTGIYNCDDKLVCNSWTQEMGDLLKEVYDSVESFREMIDGFKENFN